MDAPYASSRPHAHAPMSATAHPHAHPHASHTHTPTNAHAHAPTCATERIFSLPFFLLLECVLVFVF